MPVGIPLTAVWLADDSATAYVNNTIEAQSDGGTAFEFLGQTSDFHYFGFTRRVDALLFVMGTTGLYGALTWAYSNTASSWLQFVPLRDYRWPSATPGYMLWDPIGSTLDTAWLSVALTNPGTHAYDPPDSTARYWLRVSAASVTNIATINSVVCRPYAGLASPANVQAQLQIPTAFSTTTNPTDLTVEEFIRGAEDQLVGRTGISWRPEFEVDEELRFNMYGMKMRREDIINMYELAVYDGGSFDVKQEGRDNDFLLELRQGIISVATIFLDAMPPTFRRSYTARREQGAFNHAVRVNYSWGRDPRQGKQLVEARRIATKQTCIDIVTDLDFAVLIPLGVDTINLQAKVDNWTKDVDDFVDTYSKLRMS